MPDFDNGLDADFDSQLRGLFEQAEQVIETKSASARFGEHQLPRSVEELDPDHAPMSVPEPVVALDQASIAQLLLPVIQGLGALGRTQAAQGAVLSRLDQAGSSPGALEASGLPQVVVELRGLLEQKTGVNQRMFNALYEELQGYKDGFLLASVHRPLIRDLVSLYDDMLAIHRQMQGVLGHPLEAAEPMSAALVDRLKHIDQHVEHNVEFILEVLARMEVTPMEPGLGKLDKRTQRAMALEPALTPEEDSLVVHSLKRGFFWKDRVLRPEEVITKKWKPKLALAVGVESDFEPVENIESPVAGAADSSEPQVPAPAL